MAKRYKPYLNGNVVNERIYTGIIYKDSTIYDYEKVLNVLSQYNEYAFIVHDKEDSKPHTHILFRFSDRRQINTVANELGIPENVLKWRNSFKDSFLYLTHENKSNMELIPEQRKFIYPRDNVITSLSDEDLRKIYGKSEQDKILLECNQALQIVDFLESDKYKNYRDVIRWACKNGTWSTLRRGGTQFTRCYDEVQNERQAKKFQENFNKRIEDGKYKKSSRSDSFDVVDDEQLEF